MRSEYISSSSGYDEQYSFSRGDVFVFEGAIFEVNDEWSPSYMPYTSGMYSPIKCQIRSIIFEAGEPEEHPFSKNKFVIGQYVDLPAKFVAVLVKNQKYQISDIVRRIEKIEESLSGRLMKPSPTAYVRIDSKSDRVIFTWHPVPGAESYKVKVWNANDKQEHIVRDSCTLTIKNLCHDCDYYIEVVTQMIYDGNVVESTNNEIYSFNVPPQYSKFKIQQTE